MMVKSTYKWSNINKNDNNNHDINNNDNDNNKQQSHLYRALTQIK